jgi:uncharacterized DUF497 family protein
MLIFEWDPEKAQGNLNKHGVSFEEATEVFSDPLSLTVPDPDHSQAEDRFVTLGSTRNAVLVVVVHTDREGRVRIVSARKATPKERKDYEA